MGQIIQLHQTTAAKVRGASRAVAIAAMRLGHSTKVVEDLTNYAAKLVLEGHTAARAVRYAKERARSSAPARLA